MNDKKATYIAVVTGDLVDSSKRKGEERRQLDELLKKGLDNVFSDVEDRNDIFRGDSFQIETNAVTVLRKVLKLRSYLKMNGVEARMAIGIGGVDYTAKNVKRSDGEAYQLSGEALDNLDKSEYLKIVTPWRDLNRILDTMVVLLDSHFINHSSLQAEAVYYALNNLHQLAIAELLGITQPAVNNRLRGANFNAIQKGVVYFEKEVVTLLITKGYKGTLAYYETKIKAEPENSLNYDEYANVLERLEDYEGAKLLYEESLRVNPNNDKTHSNYASLILTLNKNVEVVKKHLEIALEINPNNSAAHNNYANLLIDFFDDKEGAKLHFEKALQIAPNKAISHYNYARLLAEDFNDLEKAKSHYEEALKIAPHFSLAQERYYQLAKRFFLNSNK